MVAYSVSQAVHLHTGHIYYRMTALFMAFSTSIFFWVYLAHYTQMSESSIFLTSSNASRYISGWLIMCSDNFITRWMVNHGWKIKIQYSDEARILTTLGTYPKFLLQCLRWSRTTWRSNVVSLFSEGTVWRAQPWSVYAIYLTSFVNFALFYDTALFYTMWRSRACPLIQRIGPTFAIIYLGLWILGSKLVKPFPHFWRNPGDLVYLPGYIVFGYFHSFIKLYALLTFGVTTWGTRAGVDA